MNEQDRQPPAGPRPEDSLDPSRKHPAHGVIMDGSRPTIVYLTVCTKGRRPWLATPEVHALLRSVWVEADAWLVGRYVVMPDHIHLFAAPSRVGEGRKLIALYGPADGGSAGASPSQDGSAGASPSPGGEEVEFDNWVKYWKSQFTKQHRDPDHRWQTDHRDTRLKGGESYDAKWEYVRSNPVRHGLVARAEDWPFQGEIHGLAWFGE